MKEQKALSGVAARKEVAGLGQRSCILPQSQGMERLAGDRQINTLSGGGCAQRGREL